MNQELKKTADQIIKAALNAVDPYQLIREQVIRKGDTLVVSEKEQIELSQFDRIFLCGAGKGAAPITRAMEELLSDRLDGGDIMMVGDHFFIGLSARTNRAGAEELIRILSKYGYTGSIIEVEGLLHLKTGIAYLENNIMLVQDILVNHPEFASYTKIIVPPEEEYAANAIRVNDFILLPSDYPITAEKLRRAGLQLIELPMSEFRKLDGGLSCLSLRW